MADPQITWSRCFLKKPYIRITKPGRDTIPFQNSNLDLCTAKSPKSVAATVPVDGSIQVELLLDRVATGTIAVEGKLATGDERNLRLFGSCNITPESGIIVVVDLSVDGLSWKMPWTAAWRYTDDISFTILASWTAGTATTTPVGSFVWPKAELYFITNDMSPAFEKGIPQEFLSLFTWTAAQMNQQPDPFEWVTWVVKRCHASQLHAAKFNGTYLTDLGFEPIHRYRYDTWSGSSAFVTQNGVQFDLERWLLYRNDDKRHITWNCFDMAYLVNLALDLGVCYYMRVMDASDGKYKRIAKEASGDSYDGTTISIIMKGVDTGADGLRFGYIKELDLTGWGNTNNPFFGGVEADMIKPADPTQNKNEFLKRTDFRNHKFVCLRTYDYSGKTVVLNALDACAGPAATIQPVTAYLSKTIDVGACTDRIALNPAANLEWTKPGVAWDVEDFDVFKSVQGTRREIEANDNRALMAAEMTPFFTSCRPTFPVFHVEDLDLYKSATGLSMNSLCDVLTTAVTSGHSDAAQPSLATMGSVDYQRTTLHYTISAQSGSTTSSTPYLNAKIYVLQNFGSAVNDLAAHLTLLDRSPAETFTATATAFGDFSVVSQDGKEAILLYRNVWLDLVAGPDVQLDAIVQAVNTYMANYEKVAPTSIARSLVDIIVSGDPVFIYGFSPVTTQTSTTTHDKFDDFVVTARMPVDAPFWVRVTVPSEVEDVEVIPEWSEYEDKKNLPSVDFCSESVGSFDGKAKLWVFAGHAYATCSGKLKVFYTEPETYFPSQKEVKFTVYAPPSKAANSAA